MLKIIIAFNGKYFPESALKFAVEINKMRPILLTGVFIPQAEFSYLWNDAGVLSSPLPSFPLLEEVSDVEVSQNIELFKTFCESNAISYNIHKDIQNFVLPELAFETRFADLLIVSSEKFYGSISDDQVIAHLRDALHLSECPVIVISETSVFPGRNILLYDGSASSVYAIKQFAYLLPELCKNETILVFLIMEPDVELPNEKDLEEFTSQHYNDVKILRLNIDPGKYLNTWLDQEKNVIVISGSYGRSKLSQMLRKSFVRDIISEHRLPVFIAHK